MAEPIYKVLTEQAFTESWSQGRFAGSAADVRDGFIHLSAAHQLEATLAAHFAGEEREDGLAQAVGPAAPHHLRRLEALLAEHARLLASLDDVIERGDALLSGSVKQVVDDVRALAQRLARHEAAETALLTDAVYADIGGG